ncbi:MAG: acyl-CoA reductase [Candidatus Aenigmarchaeota archaeon]|nr:acyl-CoA reductase [Candidatus Aenigmarchaeota archaeon]
MVSTLKYTFDAFFLPGISESEVKYEEVVYGDKEEVSVRVPIMTPEVLKKVIISVKESRKQNLSKRSVGEIVEVLDQVGSNWEDRNYELRKKALAVLPKITRFSPQMIEVSINGVLEMFKRKDNKSNLTRMLWAELDNDPKCLDEFIPKRGCDYLVRAYGPEFIVNIFSGNVPALPIVSLTRGLLVKSAQLGKVASEEPYFANLFVKSIRDVDEEIANSIALTYWKGGDESVENVAFAEADVVVAYGGVKTIESIKKRIPHKTKLIPYGHKMSFGVIGKEYLIDESTAREVAELAALDTSLYDQQGCLSPQLWYVEKNGNISPEKFAEFLAEEMEKVNQKLPRGKINVGKSSEIQQLRGTYEFKDNVKIFCSQRSTDWTVIYDEKEEFEPSCSYRFVRVKPVDDVSEVRGLVMPIAEYLQTIGVALYEDRLLRFSDEMGRIGATNIRQVGKMGVPGVGIPHDGSYGLRDLITRWVSIER